MRKNAKTLFFLIGLLLCVIVTFTCRKIEKSMLVSTGEVTDILTNSAEATGMVVDLGDGATQHGHCYGTSSNVTTAGSKTQLGTPPVGGFTSQLTNLTAGTKYYIKAYISNGSETVYGKEISFTTVAASLPTITTTAVTSITTTTASSGGNISSDGGAHVTERGVCWNTSTGPSISNSKTTDETGTGSYSSNMTGLVTGTTYYVRAYATNSAGTAYGNELIFTTTAPAPVVPTLTTTAITGITQTAAASGGNISSDGGASVAERGVCWNTSANPTIALSTKTIDGTGTGSFTSSITGLTANTTYFVRAYATNSAGTAYGNELSFTTSAIVPVVAILTTTAITSITQTTASSGGNITSDGDAPVTARGVCWNTSVNPTVALSTKTTDGTGTGSFTSSLTGLTASTTYHVRAYATNSAGTAYGEDLSFATTSAATVPTLTTNSISALASTTAISGGNIASDGGDPVTVRGVCWGITSGPTISGSNTNDGTGTGPFTSKLTGLEPATAYYARAYATNTKGITAYGNEVSFTTTIQVTDIDLNNYNTVKIGTQLWMQENLKTTKYRDGTSIKYITDNTEWSGQTSGAYCWYNNDTGNKNIYGAMYNYYATVENLNLCPTGWHVPTDAEWTTLTTYIGGETGAGGKLKEAGYDHWGSPNTGATNETGFTGLGGGHRYALGFESEGAYGWWWTSSEDGSLYAYYREMSMSSGDVLRSSCEKYPGKSVRCIQGEGQVLPAVITTAITGITATDAISGGNVTSSGNATVTVKGVCWGTGNNPTVDLTTKTVDGSGTGNFTSSISGLTPAKTYYVRAYAVNSVGTVYGNERTFTSICTAPVVTTNPASNIWNTSATLNGSINANGLSTNVTFEYGTTTSYGNTATASQSPVSGSTEISVSVEIPFLISGQTYHYRINGINECGGTNGSDLSFTTTVKDIDGNIYGTVLIGSQVWMTENLKTAKFNDNISIPNVTDDAIWCVLSTPAYCWYNNDPAAKDVYGALYDFYAASSGKLCPSGWHVPSDLEWTNLVDYLIANGYNYDGTLTGNKCAKALASATGWTTSTVDGAVGNTDYPSFRNKSGFNGRAVGVRAGVCIDLQFYGVGNLGIFWTATENISTHGWARILFNDYNYVDRMGYYKHYGLSVRCIRDF